MKIYIVICGDYEDVHNEFCHTDFDLVIDKIMDIVSDTEKNTPMSGVSNLECWEDGKLIYDYGDWCHDVINERKPISREELLKDIEYHIENRWKRWQ